MRCDSQATAKWLRSQALCHHWPCEPMKHVAYMISSWLQIRFNRPGDQAKLCRCGDCHSPRWNPCPQTVRIFDADFGFSESFGLASGKSFGLPDVGSKGLPVTQLGRLWMWLFPGVAVRRPRANTRNACLLLAQGGSCGMADLNWTRVR